jgi:hypothetical protein
MNPDINLKSMAPETSLKQLPAKVKSSSGNIRNWIAGGITGDSGDAGPRLLFREKNGHPS